MNDPIRILFFGTPDFAAVGLETLLDMPGATVAAVITQPDRPAGRGSKLQASPVKILASKRGVPVIQPERMKKHEADFLAAAAPFGPFDIGVVIAFGQILPQAVLDLPRRGCLNVHGSLLPRWRGAAPIQRALIAGDAETGVGLMQMEAGLDTGPVFSETRITIARDETFKSLHDKLAAAGAALLRRDLADIAAGGRTAAPQSESGVTYAHKITAADQLIDWTRSAAAVDALIRGFDPVPGAYTFLDGRRLKLFQPRIVPAPPGAAPGAAAAHDGSLIITCGRDAIAPAEVQPEGKKRMPTADWLRGAGLAPGLVAGGPPEAPPAA